MSDVDIFALYRGCVRSAFRLEARNRYAVPWEEEQLAAFAEGRPEPPSESLDRSNQMIRELVDAGRHISRVHVVERPLTPYLRWELNAYARNIRAGEEIRIADRAWHPDLEDLTEDFVIFDAETDEPSVVWYDYDEEDRLLGYRYSESPTEIERCRRERGIALEHAVNLDEFMAMLDED